ncbi:MAG TPA: hypothetical protein PKN27_00365 [Propionibacteriaceae bacterium]|nr:hypothetical protein [Propionibacteriaceae bacterium]
MSVRDFFRSEALPTATTDSEIALVLDTAPSVKASRSFLQNLPGPIEMARAIALPTELNR